jgi:hypothetical protein
VAHSSFLISFVRGYVRGYGVTELRGYGAVKVESLLSPDSNGYVSQRDTLI